MQRLDDETEDSGIQPENEQVKHDHGLESAVVQL